MTDWSIDQIPPMAGKLAVVTGATGGLGFETALALAGAGAEVVLTGRNDDKGSAAGFGSASDFPMRSSAMSTSIWPVWTLSRVLRAGSMPCTRRSIS